MNFAALKEFRKTQATGIKEVVSYLADELSATIRELRAGLQRKAGSDPQIFFLLVFLSFEGFSCEVDELDDICSVEFDHGSW